MQYIVSESEHKVLNAVRAHVARDAQAKQAQDVLRQADENAAFWASVARVERAGLLTAVVYVGALRTLVVMRRDSSAEEIQQAIQAVVGTAGTVKVTREELAPRSVTVTGQHEYEEIPFPDPIADLDFTSTIPGETHVPAAPRVPEFTLDDWISATPARPLEDVVTGTSERGPNPGSVGHVGRTVPAGERSTTPWDGTRLATAMGQKRLDRFDIADTLGCTRRAVGYWLSGRYAPAQKHRDALKVLLGVDL